MVQKTHLDINPVQRLFSLRKTEINFEFSYSIDTQNLSKTFILGEINWKKRDDEREQKSSMEWCYKEQ